MKPKIYTFYTDTHKELYDRFLLTFNRFRLGNSFDLVTKKFDQESSGNFMEEGWNKTMRKKVEYVLESIEETFGGWFIHADCDIQFFADILPDMEPRIAKYDLVAQSDSGTLCAGFFACRSNERMRVVFQEVLKIMDRVGNDQLALNALKGNFSHQLLPYSYFTIGNVNGGKVWDGDTKFMPPKKTFMHHANYVVGPQKKLELMDVVAKKVSESYRPLPVGMEPLLQSKFAMEFPSELGIDQFIMATKNPANDKVHMGSDYGGWTINLNAVNPGDVVLDLGLGEDISFSQDLASKRDVTIIGVDPTEKSHHYVEALPAPPLKLIKKAVAKDGTTTVKMYRNANPSHVSESLLTGHASVTNDSYDVECMSIAELRRQYPNISLIKMDIEGAEYDVLDECIGVRQLCVEFHHFCINGISINDTNRCIKKLISSGYEILDKNSQGTEFTFQLKS